MKIKEELEDELMHLKKEKDQLETELFTSTNNFLKQEEKTDVVNLLLSKANVTVEQLKASLEELTDENESLVIVVMSYKFEYPLELDMSKYMSAEGDPVDKALAEYTNAAQDKN